MAGKAKISPLVAQAVANEIVIIAKSDKLVPAVQPNRTPRGYKQLISMDSSFDEADAEIQCKLEGS